MDDAIPVTTETNTPATSLPRNPEANSPIDPPTTPVVVQSPKDRLEALQQSRSERSTAREIQNLRTQLQSSTAATQELADLKRKLANFPDHLKDFGLDPKELTRTVTSKYAKEIFDQPDDEIDPVKKELDELKSWKKQVEEREEKSRLDHQTRLDRQAQEADFKTAQRIITQSPDDFPTLMAEGDEGTELFLDTFRTWFQNNPGVKLLPGDLRVFAEIAEEQLYEDRKKRFQGYLKSEKYRSLIPKDEPAPLKTDKKKQDVLEDQEVLHLPASYDTEEGEEDFDAFMKKVKNKNK